MRFISIFRPANPSAPPSSKMIEQMGAFMAEAVHAGVLLVTDGIGPSGASDVKVRRADGKYTVTDGPFSEAKEVIGGFAIMKFKSREELLEWTRRFMEICGDGECEIHKLADESPLDQLRQLKAR